MADQGQREPVNDGWGPWERQDRGEPIEAEIRTRGDEVQVLLYDRLVEYVGWRRFVGRVLIEDGVSPNRKMALEALARASRQEVSAVADTPIETPLETARRVWPADWEKASRHHTLMLRAGIRGPARISVIIYSVSADDWVGSVDDRDVARGPDLAAVLVETRDKVQAAVADLARAVGLEVVTP